MKRLNAKELAALESKMSFGSYLDLEALEREARVLRAQTVSSMIGKGLRALASALGLQQAGEGLRRYRLYRQTYKALSKLDAHELADIGLSGTELHAASRAAAGMEESRGGLLDGLRQSMAEARDRRRTVRELSMLDRRLLQDIGVEPDGIEAYVENSRRKPQQPASVTAAAAPAVAVELFFKESRQRAPLPVANQPEEQARAA